MGSAATSRQRKIDKRFTATLQKNANKGAWTYVVWRGSADYFGTDSRDAVGPAAIGTLHGTGRRRRYYALKHAVRRQRGGEAEPCGCLGPSPAVPIGSEKAYQAIRTAVLLQRGL